MDKSKKYTEMCEKAVEIQELWKPAWGDFVYDEGLVFPISTVRIDMRELVWLPRQDQYQEILYPNNGISLCLLTRLLHEFIEPEYHCICLENDNGYACPDCHPLGTLRRKSVKSMEQLCLSFVYNELYNKYWEGKEWRK